MATRWRRPVDAGGAIARRVPDVKGTFKSGSQTLARHLVIPADRDERLPGVILCHGFPIGPLDAR